MRIVILSFALLWVPASAQQIPAALRKSLTLHATFDKGFDADVARGDRRIYHAPDYKQQVNAKQGIGDVDVELQAGAGLGGGDALRFRSKNSRALFYRGEKNVALAAGTFSFWLRLDPQKDLAPGFCDPVQITARAYNDSAIWVDFTKDEVPRHFRLGVFGDLKMWNPTNTPSDKNPDFLNRLVVVQTPPFTRDRWTHVAITWKGLGTPAGRASLYLDGQLQGSPRSIAETFDWNPALLAIRLGVAYVGLMDSISVFDRELTAGEVALITKPFLQR